MKGFSRYLSRDADHVKGALTRRRDEVSKGAGVAHTISRDFETEKR